MAIYLLNQTNYIIYILLIILSKKDEDSFPRLTKEQTDGAVCLCKNSTHVDTVLCQIDSVIHKASS